MKTKVLIGCVVCVFVFAHAERRFSHDVAHILIVCNTDEQWVRKEIGVYEHMMVIYLFPLNSKQLLLSSTDLMYTGFIITETSPYKCDPRFPPNI